MEIYGHSKWEAEKILQSVSDDADVVVLRCPTMVNAGRLGLLAILFEFIDEGRKVWVVGGANRYQFIYAPDLAEACIKALSYETGASSTSALMMSRRFETCTSTSCSRRGTAARIASLPPGLTLSLIKLAYALKLSPLGPYQYKMMAENFVFDSSRSRTS